LDICFNKIRGKNHTLFVNNNFRNEEFEQTLLAGEAKIFEKYSPALIPSSKSTKVYKFKACFGDTEKTIYLKEYLPRSIWDSIKHLFRPSRAKRSLKATLMLQENGFDAPVVVTMGECKNGIFTRRNFLATLEAVNTKQLHKSVKTSIIEKRRLVRSFGQTIGQMHANGIFHGDLRLGNILARQEESNWKFFFLDNERTKKFCNLPTRLRLKNLVQVNMFPPASLTNTDLMRFFSEYWNQNEKVKINKAKLIKKVLKKTRQRLSKQKYA